MTELIILGILLLIGILVKKAMKNIPEAHFAVIKLFGVRWRTIHEGDNLIIPFLESVENDLLISKKPEFTPISFTFPTRDDLELRWDGIVEFIADYKVIKKPEWPLWLRWILDGKGEYPTFTDMKLENLKRGLTERTQDKIKKLGGNYDAETFKTRFSRSLRYLVESIMRLEKPPHVNPQVLREFKDKDGNIEVKISDERWEELFKGFNKEIARSKVAKKEVKMADEVTDEEIENHLDGNDFKYHELDKKTKIPSIHRLEFYYVFSGRIGDILRNKSSSSNNSEAEKYYGIDIQKISNSNIDYTKTMWKALEAKKRSEKELEGQQQYHNKAKVMAKEIMDESDGSIKFNEAYDKALVILNRAKQKNYVFQGMPEKSNIIFEIDDRNEGGSNE